LLHLGDSSSLSSPFFFFFLGSSSWPFFPFLPSSSLNSLSYVLPLLPFEFSSTLIAFGAGSSSSSANFFYFSISLYFSLS